VDYSRKIIKNFTQESLDGVNYNREIPRGKSFLLIFVKKYYFFAFCVFFTTAICN